MKVCSSDLSLRGDEVVFLGLVGVAMRGWGSVAFSAGWKQGPCKETTCLFLCSRGDVAAKWGA